MEFFFSGELSCSFCLVCFHRKLVPTADMSCDIPWWLSDFSWVPAVFWESLAVEQLTQERPGRYVFSVTLTLASHTHLPALP